MHKTIKKCLLLVGVLLALNICGFADEHNTVNIEVNGEPLDVYDYDQGVATPGIVINGRTMLPLRKMFDIFGIDPSWNGADRSVSASYGDLEIWLQIDNKNAKVNGEVKTMDVPAQIVQNRTYVPVRFIAETFGVEPQWDGATRTVQITLETTALDQIDLVLQVPESLNYEAPEVFSENGYILQDENASKSFIIEQVEQTLEEEKEWIRQNVSLEDGVLSLVEGEIFKGTFKNPETSENYDVYLFQIQNKTYRVTTQNVVQSEALQLIQSIH